MSDQQQQHELPEQRVLRVEEKLREELRGMTAAQFGKSRCPFCVGTGCKRSTDARGNYFEEWCPCARRRLERFKAKRRAELLATYHESAAAPASGATANEGAT